MGCTSSKESSSSFEPGKLIYFNAHGRGEPLRMMLTYKGVKFEDEVITVAEHQQKKASGELTTALPIW